MGFKQILASAGSQKGWIDAYRPPDDGSPLCDAMRDAAVAAAQDFLGGFRITETALRQASPVRIPSDFRQQTALVFNLLFEPDELVCLNNDYLLDPNAGPGRVQIYGPGVTLPAKQWAELNENQTGGYRTRAGIWVRMNPVIGKTGSGKFGEHLAVDVAVYRFILVEF